MNYDLILRASSLLTDAIELLDQAEAPAEIGARLQEVILMIENASVLGDTGQARPAA
jgi:hypothetical protein